MKNTEKNTITPPVKSCLLALEDGKTYTGKGFGAEGTAIGELVFNTSLYGYQEILTDPSYAGQIVTLTTPEVGNYGTNDEDMESRRVYARGLVVRRLSKIYSNWRAQTSLDAFLKKHGIIGISEIDTRAVTRHIRDKGAMRCALSTEISGDLDECRNKLVEIARQSPEMTGLDLTKEVTCDSTYPFGSGNFRVAVLDFGIKQNILNLLAGEGFELTVYPSDTKAATILNSHPDGIFLSNGPGDPAACVDVLQELPQLIDSKIPMFGICLGHQLLSIALGAKTFKLKFGHRGGNQPVKDLLTGKVEITCQNHGFAVDKDSVPKDLEITHLNLNDGSVEGFRHKELPIFAVQYHPEAHPGPNDSNYLFTRFSDLVRTERKAKVI
ncbi:MAG: glutamine-hydrolyzing carbamoyl-phosphate synthase small subunit [Candidatus Obscuribacterales bacterium]|nr:glutamine-hydrolyzing carbamoyl-phosphate synthase small subunit [Candidatus Obscuribacterales bacterium]